MVFYSVFVNFYFKGVNLDLHNGESSSNLHAFILSPP